MTDTGVPTRRFGRIEKAAKDFRNGCRRVGEQTHFYFTTLRSIADVLAFYKIELLRVISQMAMGTGALLLIGGTVVILTFLTTMGASTAAVYVNSVLSSIGVEALNGFVSAYLVPRITNPLIATVGLAATIGAGATAQLGAMRINEEIDALDALSVRSVAYLASTRVLAGVIIIIPLYCVTAVGSFVAFKAIIAIYGGSDGVFSHYFYTFLTTSDVWWSILVVICGGAVVMLIHTYYGYHASGGPAGVGMAVGQATRASMIAAMFVVLLVDMAVYGPTGNFHLSG